MSAEPLSPEERAQKEEYDYRDEMERWQEREDARVAALAILSPLDGCMPLADVITKLDAVDSATGDIDVKNRIHRLRNILSLDMRALLDRLEALKVPEPQPVAPGGGGAGEGQ